MEDISLDNLKNLKDCFIGHQLCDGESLESLLVFDKYSGQELTSLQLADELQLSTAISQASTAFTALKTTSAGQRAQALHQLAEKIHLHRDNLTQLIIQEAGKPISYARLEIDRSIATIECAAQEAVRFTGEMINIDHHNGAGREALCKRYPKGIVAAISPFNFPLNLALHKIAPAIAVGCPIILKPSPFTPLSALYLAKLVAETDLPQATLQVLNCNNAIAEKLITAEEVAMVSFTGSDKVGWHIKKAAYNKSVALELGGNAALIIDDSLNPALEIQDLAKKIITGAFLYAGQICISTQRVYVHKTLYRPLLEALTEEVKYLKVGNPMDTDILMGPVIDHQSYLRLQDIVDEALQEGAEIVAQSSDKDESKNIFPATILTMTQPYHKAIQDEAFGPILCVESFSTFDEAIEMVNNSLYGLQAGVFTQDIQKMKQAHDQLEVGGVILNDIPGFRVDAMPYGGVKNSGQGREGPYYTMLEMTEPKLLVY